MNWTDSKTRGLFVVVLMIAALFAAPAQAADPAPAKGPAQGLDFPDFQKQIQPFFNKYCIACHSAKGTEPEIQLDVFSDQAATQKWMPTLDKTVVMLRGQKMPPKSKAQPTAEERKVVLEWLEAFTSGIDCSNPQQRTPGRVTLHRLNRAEYNNTIRDLFAMDFQPANAFPADDAGYGFDNNGDVLSVAPVLLEKYITAAGQVMDKALFSPPALPTPVKQWVGATIPGTIPESDPSAATPARGPGGRTMPLGRVFNYAGELNVEHEFPIDGEYVLRLRGYGRQRPNVQFMIDGEPVGRPVSLTEDIQNSKIYGPDKVAVKAGKHKITIAFVNGGTKEEYEASLIAAAAEAARAATQPAAAEPAAEADADVDPAVNYNAAAPASRPAGAAGDPAAVAAALNGGAPPATQPQARGARGARGGRGAANRGGRGAGGGAAGGGGKPVLGVVFFEVEGPQEVTPDRMPESYRRVLVARPSDTVTKAQAAEKIIRNFVPRAFRRPVTEEEFARLMDIWTRYDSKGETFEASIHTTLQAVLVSPHFLYRYEKDPSPTDAGGVRPLDEYELASRLSYFLWSSMPDEELFGLAEKGQLRANLGAQVTRMMKDPKARSLVENFAGQWLKLRMMENVIPDASVFPEFDESLRRAMITETEMLFLAIIQEDRSILDFIDANFTFLNERLAKHYGISGVTGDEFRRVQLASAERGGLLTQASVLTITSYPARTSPVQRGKWVLENLLDQSPPPPPPDVPALKEQAEIKGTLRQRMEIHRSNPACASCHEEMDAIGFGLENFNAIGAWRTTDGDSTIDPSGSLPGKPFKGPEQLKQIIKSHEEQFCKALTVKMLTYALGRGVEKFDKCTVDEIVGKMKQEGYKFSVLVNQIVLSDPFQKRAAK